MQDLVQKYDTLYSLDKTGKIRIYEIQVLIEDGTYMLKSCSGLLNGNLTYNKKISPQGKQGRTWEEQARFIAVSEWNGKRDEGYKSHSDLFLKATEKDVDIANLSIEEAFKALEIKYNTDTRWYPLPMLAEKFKLHEKKIKFPVYAQPKLNGVRCLALYDPDLQKVVLVSRGGKTYNIPHIELELHEWFLTHQNVILDGELYQHGTPLQVISGAARKGKDAPKWLEYHVYDIVLQKPQKYRVGYLMEYFEQFREIGVTYTQRVPTFVIIKNERIKEKHDMAVSKGYEGLILRDQDAEYMISFRDKCLLKVKEFEDAEFEILDCAVDPNKGIGESFVFILKNDLNDLRFSARPTGSVKDKDYWYFHIHDYIGKMCTLRFQERTQEGLPHQGHVRSDLSKCLTIELVDRTDL